MLMRHIRNLSLSHASTWSMLIRSRQLRRVLGKKINMHVPLLMIMQQWRSFSLHLTTVEGTLAISLYPGNGKFKHQNWNKKGNSFYVAPDAPDYFDFYKRAQLKAILSQVNPNLTPRLRKANTREFGVQVNPKVDATVQCSLGHKTLFYRGDKWDSPRTPSISPLKDTLPSTPVNFVRFSRPVAIYSPVFDRRIFSLSTTAGESKDDGGDESKETDSETDDDEKCNPDESTHNETLQGKSVIRRNKRSNFQVCCGDIPWQP